MGIKRIKFTKWINEIKNQNAIENAVKPFIGDISQYPEDLIDNPFITTGYRIGFHSLKQALTSLFMWHNETINVWTHLLGKVFYLSLIIVVLVSIPSYG